jgi:cell division transport system permease protein
MKSLKNTLTFVIPLTVMLITFSIYLLTNNIVNTYKKKISNDYSIVIITHTPLIKEKFDTIAGIKVNRINTLSNESIINNVKSTLSDSSIDLLNKRLPHFYEIHLDSFPTSTELKKIRASLLNDKNIKRIEIFSKNHNKIYLLLLMINDIIIVLFGLILVFVVIILSKQVTIWFFAHNQRIMIFQLHGASILYSASPVIKHAIYGAFLSFLISSGLLIFVSLNLNMLLPAELNEILNTKIFVELEVLKLFLLSFGISIVTIFGVLFRYKIKNA